MPPHFQEHRGIAEGFIDDFKIFLEDFSKTEQKYQNFLAVWNEKKGHLIYGGRRTVGELLEFTEEIMNLSANFILNKELNVPAATCGLFMIYSMVHTQHSGRKAYVRVTPDKLPWLLVFRQWAQNERKLDVLYVLSWLLRDGIFKFVATERDYGLEKPFRKYIEGPACRGANMFTSLNSTGELHETVALLDPISSALQEYHKAKCRLPGNNKGEPCRELSYVKLDFINEITSSLEEMVGVNSDLGKKEEIFMKPAAKGNKNKKIKGSRRRRIGQGATEPNLEDIPNITPGPNWETRNETLNTVMEFATSEPAEVEITFQDSTVGTMNMPVIIQEIDQSQITAETESQQIAMDTSDCPASPLVINDK